MRADMAKVIVERPRYGSSLPSYKKGYRRSYQRTAIEDRARREGMLGKWRGLQRCLNEHLGPMRRFLRSRVGRPWNDVHRELCEHVSFDNAVQKHVLAHVFQYVNREVYLQNGAVMYRSRSGPGWALRPGEMYLCPTTQYLRVVKKNAHRVAPKRIVAGELRQYHFRDGVWWEVKLQKLPESRGSLWDVWLETSVANLAVTKFIEVYGEELVAISKRPLSPAEVKQLHRQQRTARTR